MAILLKIQWAREVLNSSRTLRSGLHRELTSRFAPESILVCHFVRVVLKDAKFFLFFKFLLQ